MLTVIEEYSTYYPQEGRGHVRLKVQPAGAGRAPRPDASRTRTATARGDKLKNRKQGPAKGLLSYPCPGGRTGAQQYRDWPEKKESCPYQPQTIRRSLCSNG